MSVLSIGTFDGLHLGHQKLLARMREIARLEELQSIVVTYKDHPAFVLSQKALPKLLCPWEIKQQELMKLGIDRVEVLEFDAELAATSAEDFLEKILIPRWQPKVIVVGYDSHFGKDRRGNRIFLEDRAEQFGYRVEYISPQLYGGNPVSSTIIRELLCQGDIKTANDLLGRYYRLSGKVGKGIARGREFGFPTANLILSNPHQLLPREGIYLSRAILGESRFFGLTNIGKSPTVKHTGIVEIETFLMDFSGDIYGDSLQVELISYLREEKMFANTDALVQAMRMDLIHAHRLISGGLS